MAKIELNNFINSMCLPNDAKVLAKKIIKHLDEQSALLLLTELNQRSKSLVDLLEVMEKSLRHTPAP